MNVPAVLARFHQRGISAADIGAATADRTVNLALHGESETIWDFNRQSLLGFVNA
jgi:selenophosphate synthetase-related protein